MTHAELLGNCGLPAAPACHHQVAKLGCYQRPRAGQPMAVVGVYRCTACDLVMEVLHGQTRHGWPTMQLDELEPPYRYSQAIALRRAKP